MSFRKYEDQINVDIRVKIGVAVTVMNLECVS